MKRPRPILIEGDIAYVTLTQGYIAIIDAADAEFVGRWNWSAHIHKRSDGAIRKVYARRCERANGGQRHILLHRGLIDAPDDMDVDHRSGDGLDNRRQNLRLATKAQNCQNQTLRTDNSSGVRGVNWHEQCGKWHATIQADGKRHSLGLFEILADAKSAYALASKDMHGDFGRVP